MLIMLLLSVAIIAALYVMKVPGLPGPSGRATSTSQLEFDVKAMQQANELNGATDKHNADVNAALEY